MPKLNAVDSQHKMLLSDQLLFASFCCTCGFTCTCKVEKTLMHHTCMVIMCTRCIYTVAGF